MIHLDFDTRWILTVEVGWVGLTGKCWLRDKKRRNAVKFKSRKPIDASEQKLGAEENLAIWSWQGCHSSSSTNFLITVYVQQAMRPSVSNSWMTEHSNPMLVKQASRINEKSYMASTLEQQPACKPNQEQETTHPHAFFF
jgi:hypothetical protein